MEFTKSTTSEKIVSMLSKIFVTHGLPLSLRTDNGPQFVSDYFEKYLEENGIEHRKTTPLWPQANGEIERQNRSILKRLRIAQAEGRNWKSEMDNFLVMYRSTPHSTTGVSPAELLFGRRIRTKLPQLQEFSIEDEVRDLVQKNGNSVLVEADGVQYRRNVTHVKKYLERDNDVLPATSKSSEAQRATQTSPSREFSEPVPSGTTSEDKPVEYKHVMEQSDATTLRPSRVKRVPSKFQDYVLGCVQLVPGACTTHGAGPDETRLHRRLKIQSLNIGRCLATLTSWHTVLKGANKRKNVKDKDRIKQIRKEARKRWRNKKANEKAMKNVKKEAIAGLHCAKESNQAAELSGKTALTNQEPPKPRVVLQRHVKEIDPSLLVKSEKFLGSGTFGNCYLAYYRDVVVTVKDTRKGSVASTTLKEKCATRPR
ncbi:hypothetical protein ACROYT_G026481 [Oculina patagonica]